MAATITPSRTERSDTLNELNVQPYNRFSADFDAKDATWAVMAIFVPEKPGGHVFVLVSRNGNVLDYAVGR